MRERYINLWLKSIDPLSKLQVNRLTINWVLLILIILFWYIFSLKKVQKNLCHQQFLLLGKFWINLGSNEPPKQCHERNGLKWLNQASKIKNSIIILFSLESERYRKSSQSASFRDEIVRAKVVLFDILVRATVDFY